MFIFLDINLFFWITNLSREICETIQFRKKTHFFRNPFKLEGDLSSLVIAASGQDVDDGLFIYSWNRNEDFFLTAGLNPICSIKNDLKQTEVDEEENTKVLASD